jgi:hypothetical protein
MTSGWVGDQDPTFEGMVQALDRYLQVRVRVRARVRVRVRVRAQVRVRLRVRA